MRLGIAGLGTIGAAVLRGLVAEPGGFEIAGLATRTKGKSDGLLRELGLDIPVMDGRELARACDVIVECVPSAAFSTIAEPVIAQGRILVTVSGGALLNHPDLVEQARETGARIILATGALIGLDAVRAAALNDGIRTVSMVTRKPPKSLNTSLWVTENKIDLDNLDEALLLYDGPAREGCVRFPANVNVAAALSLAGIGPDRTALEIWADPAVERNTHTIEVDAASARFSMTIENVPSTENPGTGRITALSVLATLYGLTGPLKVGT